MITFCIQCMVEPSTHHINNVPLCDTCGDPRNSDERETQPVRRWYRVTLDGSTVSHVFTTAEGKAVKHTLKANPQWRERDIRAFVMDSNA